MRTLVLLLVVVAFLATAAAPTTSASKIPVSYSLKVTANAKTGKVTLKPSFTRKVVVKTAGGKRKVRTVVVKVPSALTTIYRGYDSSGTVCGTAAAVAKGASFTALPLGAAKLVLATTVRLSSKRYRLAGKAVRQLTLLPGGKSALCGTPATVHVDPPAVLCSQTDPSIRDYCGQAVLQGQTVSDACVYTHAPVMNGSLVSAGTLVCPSGNCWFEPFKSQPSTTWLGSTLSAQILECADGSRAENALNQVTLTAPNGQSCGPFSTNNNNLTSFVVPVSWGGTLYVRWIVKTISSSNQTLGFEMVGATFQLNGNQNGCPQLQADPNSVPNG